MSAEFCVVLPQWDPLLQQELHSFVAPEGMVLVRAHSEEEARPEVYVNGTLVQPEVLLRPGDVVSTQLRRVSLEFRQ